MIFVYLLQAKLSFDAVNAGWWRSNKLEYIIYCIINLTEEIQVEKA